MLNLLKIYSKMEFKYFLIFIALSNFGIFTLSNYVDDKGVIMIASYILVFVISIAISHDCMRSSDKTFQNYIKSIVPHKAGLEISNYIFSLGVVVLSTILIVTPAILLDRGEVSFELLFSVVGFTSLYIFISIKLYFMGTSLKYLFLVTAGLLTMPLWIFGGSSIEIFSNKISYEEVVNSYLLLIPIIMIFSFLWSGVSFSVKRPKDIKRNGHFSSKLIYLKIADTLAYSLTILLYNLSIGLILFESVRGWYLTVNNSDKRGEHYQSVVDNYTLYLDKLTLTSIVIAFFIIVLLYAAYRSRELFLKEKNLYPMLVTLLPILMILTTSIFTSIRFSMIIPTVLFVVVSLVYEYRKGDRIRLQS